MPSRAFVMAGWPVGRNPPGPPGVRHARHPPCSPGCRRVDALAVFKTRTGISPTWANAGLSGDLGMYSAWLRSWCPGWCPFMRRRRGARLHPKRGCLFSGAPGQRPSADRRTPRRAAAPTGRLAGPAGALSGIGSSRVASDPACAVSTAFLASIIALQGSSSLLSAISRLPTNFLLSEVRAHGCRTEGLSRAVGSG